MTKTIIHDGRDGDWQIDVAGPGYESEFTGTFPHRHVSLYAVSDPYYSLDFDSRAHLEAFLAQLQALADEVWPI